MPKVRRIHYEWDIETTDEHGDVVDHDFRDECPVPPTESNEVLVLVRNEYSGLSEDFNNTASLEHRAWAYVANGSLPEQFDDGYRVPKRYHQELRNTCTEEKRQ